MSTDDRHLFDGEVAREHAYLVASGVRPLAIVGHCNGDGATMMAVALRLELFVCDGATSFVFRRPDDVIADGVADFGYAGADWAIDLLRWAESDEVPALQRHRIIGLLLGYSVEAIQSFETRMKAYQEEGNLP